MIDYSDGSDETYGPVTTENLLIKVNNNQMLKQDIALCS
jgi:hypothetical protein